MWGLFPSHDILLCVCKSGGANRFWANTPVTRAPVCAAEKSPNPANPQQAKKGREGAQQVEQGAHGLKRMQMSS